MSFVSVIGIINKLPHERTFVCTKCGQQGTTSVLSIYADCQQCSTRLKLRGYVAIGGEVEDVIDAVLKWIGSGATLEAAMRRKSEVERESESESE
jgi:DNA-directed RNA polymerase subunit RPC12/RpoP